MAVDAVPHPTFPSESLTRRAVWVQLNSLNTVVIPHDPKEESAAAWANSVNDPANQELMEQRDGNDVLYLIDGKDAYREYQHEIQRTNGPTDFIYLAGWVLLLDFKLPGEFELEGAETSGMSLGFTMRELLQSAASRNVQIRVMLPKNADPANIFGNRLASGENMRVRNWISQLGTGAGILDDRTLLYGTHHQKLLIVRRGGQLTAFCGGIDVNPDRVMETDPGKPSHDVHCRVRGPAARDLLRVFCDRWTDFVDNMDEQDIDHLWLKQAPPLVGLHAAVPPACGKLSVQIGRTCGNPPTFSYDFAQKGERSIKAMLIRAIGASERFIYIEDQYLADMEIASLLKKQLSNLKHITILVHAGALVDLIQGVYRRRLFVNELISGGADKVRVYCLNRKSSTCGTHVHAKTWVFDDKFAIIGSANCNRRGYTHDSEVAAGIFDASNDEILTYTFAHQLRIKLWAHHLGMDNPDGHAELADGVASADNWAPRTAMRVKGWYPIERFLADDARVEECNLNANVEHIHTDFDWDHEVDPNGS
jgi:phosphatidylserine/phosphatidylglycerophosphate/cardiolipin synthase-like enzyme